MYKVGNSEVRPSKRWPVATIAAGLLGAAVLCQPDSAGANPLLDPPNSAASLPTPTVLRGSPLSTVRSVPICPPGYNLSGYACLGPGGGDHTENSPGYNYWSYYGYWPEYGSNDYPFGGFAGRGSGADGSDRFAGSQGGRGFNGSAGFHGP